VQKGVLFGLALLVQFLELALDGRDEGRLEGVQSVEEVVVLSLHQVHIPNVQVHCVQFQRDVRAFDFDGV
jgi:hypothetical protein